MRTSIVIKLLMILMAFLLCLPSYSLAAKRTRHRAQAVALWELKSMGVDSSVSKSVRKAIVHALKRSRDWRYISRKTILKRLRKAGISKTEPARDLAKAARVKFLLIGTLAGLGGDISLDLKVLSGKEGKALRRLSVVLPQEKAAFEKALDELLTRLLSPQKWTGSLALAVSEDGAGVFLDGAQVATTPLKKPLDGISPDKHILTIRKDGFGDFSQFVVIRYRQLAKLEVDLSSATLVGLIYEKKSEVPVPKAKEDEPEPVPTVQPSMGWQEISGWVCLGLGAVTLASSGLLAWHADELEGDIARGWWSEGNEGILKSKLTEGRRITNWSNYTLIAGGSFTLLSAGFLLWAYLAEDDDHGGSQTHAPASAALVPLSFPSGAGLGLSGHF